MDFPVNVKLSRWTIIEPYERGFIAFNTRSSVLAIYQGEQAGLIDKLKSTSLALSDKDIHDHKDFLAEFTIPTDFDELKPLVNAWHQENQNMSRFSLVIVITGACNFSCNYCFEGKKTGNITNKTESEIINFVKNKFPLEYLSVNWFGGEPLLNYDTIIAMSKEFKSLSISHKFNFISTMTTNGYLLSPTKVDELVSMGLKQALISLDGPRTYHNKIRSGINTPNSFDTIVDNVIYASNKLHISLRIHLSKENSNMIIKLLQQLCEKGIQNKVKIFFAPLHNFGSLQTTNTDNLLTDREFSVKNLFFTEKALQMGFTVGINGPKRGLLGCNSICQNQVIIDSNGKAIKCYLDVGKNDKYQLDLSSSGILRNNYEEPNPWQTYSPFNDVCCNCSFLPICWGGCHWQAIHQFPIERRCHPMKNYFSLYINKIVKLIELGYDYDVYKGVFRPNRSDVQTPS